MKFQKIIKFSKCTNFKKFDNPKIQQISIHFDNFNRVTIVHLKNFVKKNVFIITGLHFSNGQKNKEVFVEECYKTSTMLENRTPMNLRVLIDLIQKAERHFESSMDMKSIAMSLLKRFTIKFLYSIFALNFLFQKIAFSLGLN